MKREQVQTRRSAQGRRHSGPVAERAHSRVAEIRGPKPQHRFSVEVFMFRRIADVERAWQTESGVNPEGAGPAHRRVPELSA